MSDDFDGDDELKFIRSILNYEPDTGVFTWNKRTPDMFSSKNPSRICSVWNARLSGKKAGKISGPGYVYITVLNKNILAHRLAWFYVNGFWPRKNIDHKNLNKLDNRIDNLREATHSQNMINVPRPKNNTSGFKGVSFSKRHKSWCACITINYRKHHLGYFKDPEDAHAAYAAAASKHHGEFSRAA